MPTITFSLTDEDVERIADRVVEKLSAPFGKHQPDQPRPKLNDDRLQVIKTDAARLLGCSPKTIDRLIERGLLRRNMATRRVLIPMKELERFVKECSEPV